jgi:hypothetical protein
VVLEFGSATEPLFRARAKAVEALATQYADKVTVLVVYAKESHAADSPDAIDLNTDEGYAFAQPTSLDERRTLAKQTAGRLHIDPAHVVVDQFNNFSSRTYGGYPNMTFLIDAKGVLVAGYPWMDTDRLSTAIDAVLAGKAVPPQARGRTRTAMPQDANIASMSMDMTGTRGPQGIGMLLDRMTLTDSQKTAVYPAVAQFFTDLRNARQLQQNAAAPPSESQTPAVSPEELQKALNALRASARQLDEVCKANLSDQDYQKIVSAISEGPQLRRLFNADMPPRARAR